MRARVGAIADVSAVRAADFTMMFHHVGTAAFASVISGAAPMTKIHFR